MEKPKKQKTKMNESLSLVMVVAPDPPHVITHTWNSIIPHSLFFSSKFLVVTYHFFYSAVFSVGGWIINFEKFETFGLFQNTHNFLLLFTTHLCSQNCELNQIPFSDTTNTKTWISYKHQRIKCLWVWLSLLLLLGLLLSISIHLRRQKVTTLSISLSLSVFIMIII